MLKRSFEVFSVDLDMLNLLGAFCAEKDQFFCSLSYEQSRILSRSSKLNTQLFEQLGEIIGLPYRVSHNILPDFLYECIFVDMNVRGLDSTLCLLEKDAEGSVRAVRPISQEQLIRNLYTHGFTIRGVPKRHPVTLERPGRAEEPCGAEDIRYRAFVASASMARRGIYLFVNEAHYAQLMERLSLGFFSFSEEEKRIVVPEGMFRDSFKISPSKMSAYLGLMLSDGVSMRESRAAWESTDGLRSVSAPDPELNERTVFVAHDLRQPAGTYFAQNGPYVFMLEEASCAMNTLTVCELSAQETAGLMTAFRAPGRESEWSPADLAAWKKIVLAYIDRGAQLGWHGALPALPEDDALFRRSLHHYAYLLAAFLYRRLCGLMKNAPADRAIWSPDDPLEARIGKAISRLAHDPDVKNTLANIRSGKAILSIIDEDEEEEAGAVGAGEEEGPAGSRVHTGKGRRLLLDYDRDGKGAKTRMYEARLSPAERLRSELNLFDGIGLCDPRTFDQLEKLLLRTDTLSQPRRYSALIIRLPWLKGVIVRCDFHGFFREQCPVLPETIRDAFGRDRALEDIRIIVNESMLKGFKYLKNLRGAGQQDPWVYYWAQIARDNYSLLVTGRNSLPGRTARLNNQFLSTIPLSDSEMDALVARNIRALRRCLEDEDARRQFFTHASPDEGDAPDDDGEAPSDPDLPKPPASSGVSTDDIFGSALRIPGEEAAALQKKLLNTRYAKGSLQGHIRSRILECLQGRLEVAADYRFVAPDLLCMLHYLADRYLIDPHRTPGRVPGEDYYSSGAYPLVSAINRPAGADYRGHGFFYAPGDNAPWREGGDICALRNPHYALGEGAILTALSGETAAEYDRWFGHLDSCIQLPATAASTMGGADFDGDRCLCVAEPCILGALKRAIRRNAGALEHILQNRERYAAFLGDQLARSGNHPAVRQYLTNLRSWLDSCLPASFAPGHDGYCPPLLFSLDNHGIEFSPGERDIEGFLFSTFIMTTRQQIGLLSIEALRLTGSAYLTPPEHEEKDEQTALTGNLRHWLFHWRVVSLALENGAEIDMAKTGVRAVAPELRRPCAIPDDPGLKTIAALEENHASTLRIIIRKIREHPELSRLSEREFADALRRMMGEQDASLLESLVEMGKRQRREPHHNAHLLPCLVYQEVFRPDGGKSGRPLLPMPEGSGKALRDFFRDPSGAAGGDVESGSAARRDSPDDACPIDEAPLRALVWARNDQRAQALRDYIDSRLHRRKPGGADIPAKPFPRELVSDEQGIYFFKEILKFMHYAGEASVSGELDSRAAKTPDALREQLLGILGDRDQLLYFLTHYSCRHYDSRTGRTVNDMNDFLFLNLLSDSFADVFRSLCGGGGGTEPCAAPDSERQRQAEQAVRAYIDYKGRLAGQAANTEKMKARYTYSLRNLQRRFSLVKAYDIMNAYNRGFQNSPLHQLGIPEDMLKSLYVHLEDRKEG